MMRRRHYRPAPGILLLLFSSGSVAAIAGVGNGTQDERIADLLDRMTVAEKIGQMVQVNAPGGIPDSLRSQIEAGRIGSLLNLVDVQTTNEIQRIAMDESRLGIPLLIGRDVIHGFKTILPIPLGQAATWNPGLVRRGARMAAMEAATTGVNWTFAPAVDISRDPRWGRIAESCGEDPYLSSLLGVAMVNGFQGDDLSSAGTIAACAKHFAGYGASESGRDYNTAYIPEIELRNVHLRPFNAAVDAGVVTLMASFSDLNGIPASGNRLLMKKILRDEWKFDGFVVSDWASIEQLTVHGLTANDKQAAYEAASAGIGMEMASSTYADHLAELIDDGLISLQRLDDLVGDILRVKLELGLFENPYTDPDAFPQLANDDHLATARSSALQSLVLLQNNNGVLPLNSASLDSLAVIGPMADAPYEQLGTWVFDGDPAISQTPLNAIRELLGADVPVTYVRAMETTRSRSTEHFELARSAAASSDAVVVFLGEESILSGEAHSRANIDLPGNQIDLVRMLRETGKPIIAVILAGRPLTLQNIIEDVDAILFAWHPGTMGGPAIADVLFGVESPSGKLPVTFPRMVGQVPIYYAHKNTGKPATPETYVHLDDLPVKAPQTTYGMTSHHLDAGYEPLYPFGYGLSYTRFSYADIESSKRQIEIDESLTVQAVVRNEGSVEAEEIAQLYVRDLVGNVTRPVRELKGFQRLRLRPGESRTVSFVLSPEDLAFYGRDMRLMTEAGDFHVWIGGSSDAGLRAEFTIVDD